MRSKLNHFLYRFKYNYGLYLPLQKPVDVSLELSSFCDMRCGYCYHANQDNLPFQRGHMDIQTAKRIIKLSANAGVHSLKFNWKGESSLNKHYAEITEYARKLRKGSTFIELLANSNFNFKPSDEIYYGLSNLTKVKISYDSFDKETFEAQRINGDHDKVTQNIDNFYNYPLRWENNTKMVIQAVRTDRNANENLEEKLSERWPDAEFSIRDMVQGRNEQTTEGFNEIDPTKRKPCYQAFVRLIFNAKGDAMMCCPDIGEKLNLGNIWNHDSIESIFQSPEAERVRASLKDGSAFDKDPCKTCSSYESYKGFKKEWGS